MDKLLQVAALIQAYKDHPLTLIDDRRTRISDMEAFIVKVLTGDVAYTTYSDGGVLYITVRYE